MTSCWWTLSIRLSWYAIFNSTGLDIWRWFAGKEDILVWLDIENCDDWIENTDPGYNQCHKGDSGYGHSHTQKKACATDQTTEYTQQVGNNRQDSLNDECLHYLVIDLQCSSALFILPRTIHFHFHSLSDMAHNACTAEVNNKVKWQFYNVL